MTYATIEPDKVDKHIAIAVEWLEKYMNRYTDGERYHPILLHDFDEHVEWFPTDLKLNSITENEGINTDLLKAYFKENSISLERNIIIGDGNILINSTSDSNVNINK